MSNNASKPALDPSFVVRARDAYAIYMGASGGLNYQGQPCPALDDVPEQILVNWYTIALRFREHEVLGTRPGDEVMSPPLRHVFAHLPDPARALEVWQRYMGVADVQASPDAEPRAASDASAPTLFCSLCFATDEDGGRRDTGGRARQDEHQADVRAGRAARQAGRGVSLLRRAARVVARELATSAASAALADRRGDRPADRRAHLHAAAGAGQRQGQRVGSEPAVTATPIEQQDANEWTLATVEAAAAPVADAHGLAVRAFMVGGNRPTAVRIELLRGDVLTCWIELPAAELDTASVGVTGLIEREVAALVRLR